MFNTTALNCGENSLLKNEIQHTLFRLKTCYSVLMLFQKLVLHAHVHMPADKSCLYAGTVQLIEVDFNNGSFESNDLPGHLTHLIFNAAKKIMHSTVKLARYENQFRC